MNLSQLKKDADANGFIDIPLDELQLGMVVQLDVHWLLHPFAKNTFRITKQAQLDKIKTLKIKKIKIDLNKSSFPGEDDVQEFPPDPELDEEFEEPGDEEGSLSQSIIISLPQSPAKDEKRFIDKKDALKRSKSTYQKAITIVDDLFDGVEKNDIRMTKKSSVFIEKISHSIAEDSESLVHFVNLKKEREFIQFHALNVCIISLLMGKVANLNESDMKVLGMGALFHDVGYRNIPLRLVMKKQPLTTAEKELVERHCEIGAEITTQMPDFPREAIEIVKYHHERIDGSGYPEGLTGENISFLTKIVAIADCYDNLAHFRKSETNSLPHTTLSNIYKNMKDKLPINLIEVLIKSLGVYPPGSLVQLSNERVGLVISVNHNSTIKPTVMVFNPGISKFEPELVDLYENKDISITKALSISEVSQEVRDYLEPGRIAGYSFQSRELDQDEVSK